MLQGWAVVDNTVGADWDNVQLALVAGAPQSFIQPLSQPLYARRPEIPISTTAQTTPQTHEAAENLPLAAPSRILNQQLKGQYQLQNNFAQTESVAVNAGPIGGPETIAVNGLGTGSGGGVGGGVYRPTDAIAEGDVSTNAFDDFFEYALTQPVTIHKNESAMVPILQQELPAEHVTLWSEREPPAAARGLARKQLEAHSRLRQLLPSSRAASSPARACSIPSIRANAACSPTPPTRPSRCIAPALPTRARCTTSPCTTA